MTSKTANALDGLPGWVDPVIVEMFKRLPIRNSEWPLDQRALWLSAMEQVLHMVYGPVERIDISALLIPAGRASTIQSSDEPTDEALAEAEGAASGSSDAKTTEAPDADRMGSERSSSSETAAELAVKSVSAVAAPTAKNVGGSPSKVGRPDGIPSNLQMAVLAIAHHNGRASAPQIREYVRKHYWPACQDHWSSSLYDLVSAGKLARSGLNFIVPTASNDRKPAAPAPEPKKIVLDPKPKAPPKHQPPRPAAIFTFDHDGKSASLGSSTCFVLASKLRAAMGKGHVSESFLADSVFGSNTDDRRRQVKDLCMGMNDQLADVGLKVEHYPGFGLVMKELP